MSDPSANHFSAAPLAAPTTGPRGYVVISWLLILAMGGGLIYWQNEGKKQATGEGQAPAAQLIMLEFQARLYVGMVEFTSSKEDPAAAKEARAKLVPAVEALNRFSVAQRLGALITLGELAGPERARDGLLELQKLVTEHEVALSERDRKNLEILTRLYTDYSDKRPNAPTVAPDERTELETSLGWFGDLALNPANPDLEENPKRVRLLAEASQTFVGALLILAIALGGLIVGMFGLLLVAILALKGVLKSRLGPAVAHHGVYAETFALWFIAYFALAWGSPSLTRERLSPVLQAALPMILSLFVLVWPVVRGIAWKQVRQDIGLNFGSQPLVEPILGFISYLNSLPFLIVGFSITMVLFWLVPRGGGSTDLFAPDPSMAHPLIEQLRNATAADVLPYFFLMCVCAPVMEEIMFRGCLYRHLRDATRTWTLSVVVSALIVSVLFAAAHPQGVFAIPILASLACGFTLAREWRGTLIPSIIAHGLNNSLILAFAILCLMKW
ncbi:MAG: type II CAAX endopeptidase family protein [Planctomycetota bacterium]